MTEELQDAYNEWLLKYGFRWVGISVLQVDLPLFWSSISYGDTNKYVRYSMRKYQLKTSEEIQND